MGRLRQREAEGRGRIEGVRTVLAELKQAGVGRLVDRQLGVGVALQAVLVGRAGRFFLVGGLVKLGGEKLETSLRRYVEAIGWSVTAIVIIGVIVWLLVRG